jgi:DNA-binding LacI/PurR family transcriptional regulator
MVPMRARRPTIDDVAKAAGVSRTTTSDALNGTGRVGVGTRDRVRRVAAELGYRANNTARGLRMGRTFSLGLMLPHGGAFASSEDFFGIDFYLEMAVGAAHAAFSRRHGLTLLPDVVAAGELRHFPLDGVIVNDPLVGDPRLAALEEVALPYVTIERALDRPAHRRWVCADTVAGTRQALDQLAVAGATRVALLSHGLPWAWLTDTEDAYRAWCAERAAEPLVVAIEPASPGKPPPVVLPDGLFEGPDAPDAFFTAPERYAVAVAGAIAKRGLRVGEDILLACGVDSHQAREHTPPITALDLHPHALAEAAVELMLAGDEEPQPRVLAPTLRVRASSGGRG